MSRSKLVRQMAAEMAAALVEQLSTGSYSILQQVCDRHCKKPGADEALGEAMFVVTSALDRISKAAS